MSKNLKLLFASLASALLLAGCYIPEKFSSELDIKPDASYLFTYSGTTIHGLAAMAIKEKSWSDGDDKSLVTEAKEMVAKKSFVKKAEYKGNARMAMDIAFQGKPGQKMTMFDVFNIHTDQTGNLNIGVTKISAKDVAELKKLNITIDGKLSVSIPKNATVVSHNATSTPTFGFGSYSWKIGAIDQAPFMKIKFNP